ncbi:unnamed protein product [Hymenolepis diminuta]|uniref:Enkurin domain-containing protein n=1 Tax=Hymenolepis diminuta TaxID=6216 RepID=A0A0R3SA67_HYMDI|nr:unnamed protein product [Hymenolepis diminuta]
MNVLQWQNYPLSSPSETIQHRRYGRRTSRNFIRENIENLRYSSHYKADLLTNSNGNLHPISDNVQRYFDNVDSNRNRVGASLSVVSTGGSIQHVTQQKQSIFQKGVKCSIPSVTSKNVKFRTRNVNYVQANAKAVSEGNVPDRRPANKPNQSLSSDRQSLGKLPPYLIRRKNEEAERIAAEKATEGREQTPVGNRRVSEEERINTLHSLEEGNSVTHYWLV